MCISHEIAPGASADYTFLLAWHFPNRTPERCGWKAPAGEEKTLIGNWYCTRFADAWKAAQYQRPICLAWKSAPANSWPPFARPPCLQRCATPPPNLSTYATQTCFRTADGAFHGFEGCNNDIGSCFGNSTHVWNYEVSSPHLFPTLSRSLRESAFGFCTRENGRADFRQFLPDNKQHFDITAADGQMGSVLRLYLRLAALGR